MGSDHLINEQELIAASKKDPVHFKAIYEYYYRSILNYIYHRTNEINDAADIASSVFYKALVNLGKYKDIGYPFGTWLYKIAYNETMLYFRKYKKEMCVVLDDSLIDNLAEEIQADNKQMLLNSMTDAIGKLSPEETELLELKYYQRIPNSEIAYRLGISEGNLKVKAHRVIRKIKNMVHEKNGTI